MSPKNLQKAYKHNRKRYPCGCCDWIKADRKYWAKKLENGLSD
ncbi:MAG: hypothetical protein MRECE_42c001 [Mycoplasmataceae bacterium CE_OT135]|nr:MAG: hypothetical protein MRECE_42c001 [Mycoplasmataceae bacterium CE_OT135]